MYPTSRGERHLSSMLLSVATTSEKCGRFSGLACQHASISNASSCSITKAMNHVSAAPQLPESCTNLGRIWSANLRMQSAGFRHVTLKGRPLRAQRD